MIDSVEKSALEHRTSVKWCAIFACFRRWLKYRASFTDCFNQSQPEGSVEYFSDTVILSGKVPMVYGLYLQVMVVQIVHTVCD